MSAWLFQLFFDIKHLMIPGISGNQVADLIETKLEQSGLQSALFGFHGFGYSCCISINWVAAHGVPNSDPFQSGDIITVDLAITDGMKFADSAWTYLVGPRDPIALQLISAAWRATIQGCLSCLTGKMIGDITRSAYDVAQQFGYQIPKNCYGHGIGNHLHMSPRIPFDVNDPLYTQLRETPFEENQYLNVEPILYKQDSKSDQYANILIEHPDGLLTPNQAPAAQYELTVIPQKANPTTMVSSILSLPSINPFDPRIAKFPPFF
jgi:methionyl aminopeptidase